MVEERSLLYVLDVREARRTLDTHRIVVLAAEARKVRDSILEALADAAPGQHKAASSPVLSDGLAAKPEFVALRRAIAELPRDMREKLWAVMQIGRGDAAIVDWDKVLATGSELGDDDIADHMISEPDLENCLHKGLYELGVAGAAGNVR
jgi:Protein of unknown function (DUF3775)